MNRTDEMFRDRSCRRKVRFDTPDEAGLALGHLRQQVGPFEGMTLRSYPCYYCKGWHIGHNGKGKTLNGIRHMTRPQRRLANRLLWHLQCALRCRIAQLESEEPCP